MTNSDKAMELIKTLASDYVARENIKELCFAFRQDGSFSIGVRKKLIEEDEWDSNVIQIE